MFVNKYLECQRAYSSTVSNLKLVTATTYNPTVLTRTNCESELAKVSADYKAIVMLGHRSATKAEDRKYENCVADNAWKEKGWLGSATPCTSGVQGVFSSSICNRKMTGLSCLTGHSDVCQLGNNGLMMRSNKVYSHSATLKNDTCCNLYCYDSDALWYMFNNQPLCSGCIIAFSNIYLNKDCIKSGPVKSYSEIIIAKGETLFKTEQGQFICTNRVPFNQCCGGEGPTSLKSFSFKDHHCACAPAESGLKSDIKSKINVYLKRLSELPWVTCFSVAALFFMVNPRAAGIAIVVIAMYYVVEVEGACSIDQLVPSSSAIEMTGDKHTMLVRMRAGQCISTGDATLELLEIEAKYEYNYLRTIPYHIKPVCQTFDYGCLGGTGEHVWDETSDCFDNCVNGLRYQWKKSQLMVASTCFWKDVTPIRIDACFDMGKPLSMVQLYTKISVTPEVSLKFKIHGLGLTADITVVGSTLDLDSPVSVFSSED